MKKILYFFEMCLLILLWYWGFQWSQIHQFDIDEFAHLHWTHNILVGLKPYTDFFYFLPPVYLFVLAPLFFLVGKGVAVVLAARALSFVIFLLSCLFLFLLVKMLRNTETALLATLVFSFLPVPFDKWIEIRPDGIGTLFVLASFFFLIHGLRMKKWCCFFSEIAS